MENEGESKLRRVALPHYQKGFISWSTDCLLSLLDNVLHNTLTANQVLIVE